MNITLPKYVTALGSLFSASGCTLYTVGGLVRNAILGVSGGDCDICSAARPDKVIEILDGSFAQAEILKQGFGTVIITGEYEGEHFSTEYTTFREDSYGITGEHRPNSVSFTEDINKDALRRDFSCNAIYANAVDGSIVDPLSGIDDIKHGVLRTVCPNPDKTLQDDGLRILRLVRFAAELSFEIAPATFESAKRFAPGLSDITAERIWQEFSKILMADTKYGIKNAHYRGLVLLNSLDALDIIIPELSAGKGLEQRKDYHAYDVFGHSLYACAAAVPELAVRLAALLHDVGKPYVHKRTGRMLYHDEESAALCEELLTRLRVGKELKKRVVLLVRSHMFDLSGTAKIPTVRCFLAKLGLDAARQFILLREADVHGSGLVTGEVDTAEKFKRILSQMQGDGTPFSVNELGVSGDELMNALNIPPSPAVNDLKNKLWLHCVRTPSDNEKQRLLNIAKGYMH